jgi:hypothetical protein
MEEAQRRRADRDLDNETQENERRLKAAARGKLGAKSLLSGSRAAPSGGKAKSGVGKGKYGATPTPTTSASKKPESKNDAVS